MSVTSNALLRHITIDACLRDTTKKYSLNDLIAACTKAVKENSKTKLKENFSISTRTVQLDLQFMRDKKKGYNAPIVVYEQKYYRYKDPNYSIGNANVKQKNLAPLSEIAETLRRYAQISGMESLSEAITIIQDVIERKIEGGINNISPLELPKVSQGRYFDVIKDAVVHHKVLSLSYSPEGNLNCINVIFYPLFMKSYCNRWYVLGYEEGREGIHTIPTDSVISYSYAILPFPPNYKFNPDEYFADIIGVTKPTIKKEDIVIQTKGHVAQNLISNPLHPSQKLLNKNENGEHQFKFSLIPNVELYRWVYENMPNATIISPKNCAMLATDYIKDIIKDLPKFIVEKPKKEGKKKTITLQEPDLFSNL